MSKEMNLRECLNALDDIEAPTSPRAHYEIEQILFRYVNPRVALAARKALERAAKHQQAHYDSLTSPRTRS